MASKQIGMKDAQLVKTPRKVNGGQMIKPPANTGAPSNAPTSKKK